MNKILTNPADGRFNLLHLAFVLQGIPIISVGLSIGLWLAGVTMPNQLTTGILVATAIVAFWMQRQTKKLLASIKADRESQSADRLSRIARNTEILEIIMDNTKLALLLNIVGFGILLI